MSQLDIVVEVVQMSPWPRPRLAERRSSSAHPLVLLVDDSRDNREMYAEYLRLVGYVVIEAANGQQAMTQIAAVLPDVVVTDLSLPIVDGWQMIRRLKAAPRTRHIPILVLTGHALDRSRQEARRAGADAFVLKPCFPEDLEARIEEMLSTARYHSRSR